VNDDDKFKKVLRDNAPGAQRGSRLGSVRAVRRARVVHASPKLILGTATSPVQHAVSSAMLQSLAASLGGREALGALAAGRGGIRVVTADGEEQECVVM